MPTGGLVDGDRSWQRNNTELTILLFLAALAAQAHHGGASPVPPVPGGCTEPAAANVGKPGCFSSGELRLERSPRTIYWHVYDFADSPSAAAEAAKHRWSSVAASHGRNWLFVLGPRSAAVASGRRIALVGPMRLPKGRPMVARFLESDFPPGMRTRVHSHPGPEGFYVVEGEQCMDTPTGRRKIGAGGTFIVAGGAHMQAAPKGRKNIAVVFYPPDVPWMRMEAWHPSGFCTS